MVGMYGTNDGVELLEGHISASFSAYLALPIAEMPRAIMNGGPYSSSVRQEIEPLSDFAEPFDGIMERFMIAVKALRLEASHIPRL